jgi:hypothetical protein
MTSPQIIALVFAVVCIDALIVGAILHTAGQSLRELSAAFPQQPTLEGTPTCSFQSVSIGLINLGGCVHIAIDGNSLHLSPTWFARRLGMKPASIPHACIKLPASDLARAKTRANGMTLANLRPPSPTGKGTIDIRLPAWAVAASLQLRAA